jgi:hypothetical protein
MNVDPPRRRRKRTDQLPDSLPKSDEPEPRGETIPGDSRRGEADDMTPDSLPRRDRRPAPQTE